MAVLPPFYHGSLKRLHETRMAKIVFVGRRELFLYKEKAQHIVKTGRIFFQQCENERVFSNLRATGSGTAFFSGSKNCRAGGEKTVQKPGQKLGLALGLELPTWKKKEKKKKEEVRCEKRVNFFEWTLTGYFMGPVKRHVFFSFFRTEKRKREKSNDAAKSFGLYHLWL